MTANLNGKELAKYNLSIEYISKYPRDTKLAISTSDTNSCISSSPVFK